MTIPFSFYSLVTGIVERADNLGSAEEAEASRESGQGWVEGYLIPGEYYVAQGAAHPLPPRPSMHHQWDGEAWIDPRTPEDIAAEEAAALQARRDATFLPKEEFLLRCMMHNVLTPAEAKAAARGEIPDSFVPVLETLPAFDRDMAEIVWASVRNVARMDPFVLAVAQAINLDEQQLDLLFGVQYETPPVDTPPDDPDGL